MRKSTKNIFKCLLESNEAIMVDGLKNPVKITGDTMIMYCTYKNDLYECLLDTNQLDKLKNKGTWIANVRRDRGVIYVISSKCSSLHRHLADCPTDMVIDHKNGNGLDNRLINLRIVKQGSNMLNKTTYSNNKTGCRNVTIKKHRYQLHIERIFYDFELAKEVVNKINEILDYYSELDIKNRK